MNSKYEAVEHFRFMKKIYDRIQGSGFDQIDLCGVLLNDKYAYSSNNHIIGRVTISDGFPLQDPVFWSYIAEESENINRINTEKFMLNIGKYTGNQQILSELIKTNFTIKVNYFFSRYTENCFFLNRREIMDYIHGEYGSQAKKAKIMLNISAKYDDVFIHSKPIKKSTSVFESRTTTKMFCSPLNHTKIRVEEGSFCAINALYLYEILENSLYHYDIIGIKFRPNLDCPVIIFGQDKKGEKPEIFWAIAQTIL
jgi:hypothetical protein